ncbi:MAG TPA: bifunctional phosphoribosylaminoimidazolecarboxamide formyltransferase/IMP cyclohydrolase PurH, partial [Flavobacteriaceae bacterium]|nr:bifunctional phosphoribosylaminoimidazolecarboxamide formyltransferase/IMP cyclohydrolase PurH [Flavobacteriaceae bacterium]
MNQKKRITSALISVFHKEGLAPIVKKLHELGVKIYSTGGTEKFIKELEIPVIAVEDITSYPSILGGRVKTLHPKVFGGILNRQGHESDEKEIKEYDIPQIDLVIVDLYPFEKTVASGAPEEEIIEKIDIGGISLIRAAAKNFRDVLCISSRADYEEFLNLLSEENGETTISDRKHFATKAFQISFGYDHAISAYFQGEGPVFQQNYHNGQTLRYGENPHQKGWFFGDFDAVFDQLHGK